MKEKVFFMIVAIGMLLPYSILAGNSINSAKQMKRKYSLVIASLLASAPMASAQVSEGDDVARIEQDITKFYRQYLSDRTSLQGLDSLAKSFLTDGMYDRLHRASSFFIEDF